MPTATVRSDSGSRIDLNPVRVGARPVAADDNPEAMKREDLENFIFETRNEPPWRRSADLDVDYYDGNQLRPDTLGEMEDRGIPPIIINLTQPIVNAVLGMEAKTRSDWEVTGDDKPSEMVARMLDERLKEAERESGADRAISDAYAGQIKGGLGWVEVGRETDPFLYPYRVNFVHRREIWWDWRARNNDLRDARYLIRRRWYDEDVLSEMLPHYKDLIRYAINGWAGFSNPAFLNSSSLELGRSYEEERATSLDQYEWLDTGRRRAQVFEVWYRKWVRGFVFRLGNNKVIEVDRKNQRHLEVIASGAVQPIPAVFPRVRVSMWIGPHRISDIPSPFPHRHFPYVPFWGFREDLTGAPYGIIRALRSPQDEINARRSKLLSLITGRRVVMDSDALNTTFNTVDDVADEVGRSDAMIILNPNRKHQDGFKVETNSDLAAGQMKMLADHKAEMHEVSGVFPPSMGDPKDGLSGVAIDSLVDQSATTLAEINDNHRFGRRMVGEQLLSLVRQDLTHEHEQVVGKGRHAKSVYFNREYFDPEQNCNCIENSVADANIRVTLSEVPSTQSYRQAQFARLAELTKSLPPDVQRFVMDFVIEASDVQGRDKIAERLRKALGLADPNADEEGGENDAANQQIQQLMAEHQQVVQELMGKLQPALAEIEQLKLANANKQAEAAVEIERERTRQMEVQRDEKMRDAEIVSNREIELERLDLERDKMSAEERKAAAERAAQESAASAVPEKDDAAEAAAEARITALTEDVRDMVKALADEFSRIEKTVADLKKDEGKEAPEPVKAEDIAAALTKALAPILERKEEKSEPVAPQPIVVVVPGNEGDEVEKTITIQSDAKGVPQTAKVTETRKKKPKK